MVRIGNVEIPGLLALGPMAGVTDMAFRTICREMGAALTYTEMVSSRALVYQDKKTRALLELGPGERPCAVQIFGSDPEVMARGAQLALAHSGAQILDINMGCPVGKVVKSGDGSALMRRPELAEQIVRTVAAAVSVPVTVKIRKGWDKGSVNAVEFAQMLEQAGASAVCVHGRTRVQMYAGRADWDSIRAVKQAVHIPVIANGDVFSPEDARRILDHTGADMVMIGRGAFGDPWLFQQARAVLAGEAVPPRPPLAQRCETALRQFTMACAQRGEKIGCLEARKHYAWYLRGVPHSAYFKGEIMKMETLEDIRRITAGIQRELRDPETPDSAGNGKDSCIF